MVVLIQPHAGVEELQSSVRNACLFHINDALSPKLLSARNSHQENRGYAFIGFDPGGWAARPQTQKQPSGFGSSTVLQTIREWSVQIFKLVLKVDFASRDLIGRRRCSDRTQNLGLSAI